MLTRREFGMLDRDRALALQCGCRRRAPRRSAGVRLGVQTYSFRESAAAGRRRLASTR